MAEKNSKGIFDLSSVYDRVVAGNLPVAPTFIPENLNRNTVLQIQGKNALDGNNKTFLDSSGNGLALTPTGTPTQGSFSPFSPAGWSGVFNGSADYLNIPYNATHALTNQNFTIEAWINPSVNSTEMGIINNWQGGGAFIFSKTNTNKLSLSWTSVASGLTSVNLVGTAQNVIIGQWNHVAAVRNGATVTLYVNGVADATTYAIGTGAIYYYNGGTKDIRIGTGGDLGLKFNGYISNLRMVVGFAVYTSNFTPSTAPLTAITGTVLLALQDNRFKDNSVTNNTVTVVGTPAVSPFSPFSQTADYNKNVHGGSGYFNGSTDYLTIPTTSGAMDYTGDFTTEMWIYWVSMPTTGYDDIYGNNSVTGSYILGTSSASTTWVAPYILRLWVQGVGTAIDGTTVLTAGQWYHIAHTRTNGINRLFVNGTLQTNTYTDTTSRSFSTNGVTLAKNSNAYVSNFRFIKGTALYTTTFTPPTSPLTPVTNTSLLVKFDNAAIVDSTTKNNLITVGDTKLSTAVTKFNKSAMYFDGTEDYLVIPSSANYGYGTGDFTIEFWLYLNSVGTQTIISSLTSTSSVNPHLYYQTGQGLKYFTNSADRIAGSALAINTWYYIALCRAAGSTKLFINGVQTGSTYTDANNYGTSAPLVVGTYYSSGTTLEATSGLNGYIDDLRITKGIARYTNLPVTDFSPPTDAVGITVGGDAYWDSVNFLINSDSGSLVDRKGTYTLSAIGTTAINTSIKKYGAGSVAVLGGGNTASLQLIAGNITIPAAFTLDGWVYLAASGRHTILGSPAGSAYSTTYGFGIFDTTGVTTNTKGLCFMLSPINGYSGNMLYTGQYPPLNTWTHFAIQRNAAGEWSIFMNGVKGTLQNDNASTHSNSQFPTNNGPTGSLNVYGLVGNWDGFVSGGNSSQYSAGFNGYLDDFRLTLGVARYTSTFIPTPLEKDKTLALEVLIVAGGGGGGRKRTPGGGAGGLLYYGNNTTTKTPNGPPIIAYSGTSYAVAVGLGGATNVSGANSSFGSYVSYGGQGNNSTVIGGSAAGVGTKLWTQGQGQGGGVGANGGYGGGGGAGEQGKTGGVIATNTGGYGGNGLSYSEFTSVAGVPAGWFAGGGGGGGLAATAASGGPGGLGGGGYGGNVYGSQTTAYGYNGNAYTGGGGGGTSDVHSSNDAGLGAQGGSGIVIVSYAGTSALASGGTISTTARPGYVCHTFTGAGTFSVT